jgi:hypothetical protein
MEMLISFPPDGSGAVIVQVDERQSGSAVAASPGELVAKAKMTFEVAK